MGGDVWLESQVGEGTTVHLHLPLANPSAETQMAHEFGQSADAPAIGTRHILLVEDEPYALEALAEMLEVEPITLGRMIDRLQDAELVERRADPKDRRAWRLHLTAKGRAKIKELEPTASALFVDALQGIDEAKQAELEEMLNIIRSNLTRKPMEAANG